MPLLSLPGLELARFRRSMLTKLALVVAVVIPMLYGGLYLSANWNPSARLDQLTGAVVDLDQPASTTGADGSPTTVDAGRQIVDTLTGGSAGGFTWVTATPAEASDGLDDGRYAAVITIPQTFSADLSSIAGASPTTAGLTVATNDANNYLVGTITNTITTNLRDSLDDNSSRTYLDNIYQAFNRISDSLGQAATGAGQVADGAAQVDDGAGKLSSGLATLDDGAGKLTDGTGRLADGASSLATGARDLSDGANKAAGGAADLSSGLAKLRDGSAELPGQTRQLADGATTLAAGAHQVADGTAQLAQTAQQLTDLAAKASPVPGKLDELSAALAAASTQAAGSEQRLGSDILPAVRALADAQPDNADVQRLLAQVSQAADGSDTAGPLSQVLGKASTDAATLAAGLQTLGGNLGDADDKIQQLAAGAAQVASGADQLAAGNGKLAAGIPTLTDGIATAADGAGTLADGTAQLASGAGTLADGAAQVSDGATQADTGARQLASGIGDAHSGATQLVTGADQLATGSRQLADQLSAGTRSVPTYDDADRADRAAVAARPVDTDRTRLNAVASYGDGLAPYFLPLALWIGGMISYMLLRALSARALASTMPSWRVALSGWLPGAALAVLQAVALISLAHFAVGVQAPNLWALYGFAVLTAVVFASIHQACNALLGSVGRLVALILLMLQLASAGGTYPMETAPAFFHAISPFLPLTWAVRGFRHLIAGGDPAAVAASAVALVAFGAVALGITVFAAVRGRTWTIAKLHPSLSL